MPIVPITITNNSPAVTVTTASPSLSYEQVLFTLNTTAYKVKEIAYQAQSYTQLSEPINYTQRDASGVVLSKDLSPAIDMYQSQATINGIEVNDMILDVLSTFSFNLEPNEILQLTFDVDQFSVWDVRNNNNVSTTENGQAISVKQKSNAIPVAAAVALIIIGIIYFYPETIKT